MPFRGRTNFRTPLVGPGHCRPTSPSTASNRLLDSIRVARGASVLRQIGLSLAKPSAERLPLLVVLHDDASGCALSSAIIVSTEPFSLPRSPLSHRCIPQ